MAFTPIDQATIAVGKPVREDLWQKTKDNFDNHESRIGGLEAGQPKTNVFNFIFFDPLQTFAVPGPYTIGINQAQNNFNLVTAIGTNFVDPGGGNGVLEFDVLKGATPDVSLATSVFSTRPSVTSGGGNYDVSSNAVFQTQAVVQNEWLFLQLTSFMTGQGSFHVQVYGEVN